MGGAAHAGTPCESRKLISPLLACQNVEPSEGSDGTDGRWRIAPRSPRTGVISIVNTEARQVHKTANVSLQDRQVGTARS
jgi:hypothetical protein